MQRTIIHSKPSGAVPVIRYNLRQQQYESGTWIRSLDFIMEENIHLKNRLSEILKNKFDTYLLEEADSFQTGFIKKDEMIKLLRTEIAELDDLFEKADPQDKKMNKFILQKTRRIRNNLFILEKQFGKLKSSFNHFLSENIL